MSKRALPLAIFLIVSAITVPWLFLVPNISISGEVSKSGDAVKRGEYLVIAGGCISCHRGQTEQTSESLAGGLGIETAFGTFFAPNITPDTATCLLYTSPSPRD